MVTKEYIQSILHKVPSDVHKGNLGHVLVIGGSFGKIGAVSLTSKAALKSGCGLVSAFIPKCGYDIIQTSIPEVMVLCDDNEKCINNIQYDFLPNVIAIGPGMGLDTETQHTFHKFLKNCKQPVVIDADGINILALNKNWLNILPKNSILTPHNKELERLIGPWDTDVEKLKMTENFVKKYNVILVEKGVPSKVHDAEKVYVNTTGNFGLATAGSGDVLTGLIAGLIAQKYEPIQAAVLGVYLHGLTADIAAPETSCQAFIASDIINYLGKAYLSLKK
jgi:hydroxyethylthiazole kinase-like uncharacterized protein yjeF